MVDNLFLCVPLRLVHSSSKKTQHCDTFVDGITFSYIFVWPPRMQKQFIPI